ATHLDLTLVNYSPVECGCHLGREECSVIRWIKPEQSAVNPPQDHFRPLLPGAAQSRSELIASSCPILPRVARARLNSACRPACRGMYLLARIARSSDQRAACAGLRTAFLCSIGSGRCSASQCPS